MRGRAATPAQETPAWVKGASASARAGPGRAHHRSSGLTRLEPSNRKHRTSPMFDGLKT